MQWGIGPIRHVRGRSGAGVWPIDDDGVLLGNVGRAGKIFGRGTDGGGGNNRRCGIIVPSPLLRVHCHHELTRVG